MFVFIEGLLMKSKSFDVAKREMWVSVLNQEKSILQTSHFERVAQFAIGSELPFSIAYTAFISKCSRVCIRFVNAN